MSATMTEDVEALKGLTLRNPVSAESPRSTKTVLTCLTGDIETRRGRRRAEKPDTILRPVFRSRQVPVDVCHPEIEAGQGEVHSVRQRCRKMLSAQAVLGAILD